MYIQYNICFIENTAADTGATGVEDKLQLNFM